MNESIDISKTIAPKSDQLNADDLIAGPKTITVTGIKLVAEDQPVAIHFEGDDGKPYKPCKSMRRVLIKAWGPNGAAYVGRSMTLFLDEQVRFGGAAVGGIRISHLSHISKSLTMALTATRATKRAYTVGVLASLYAGYLNPEFRVTASQLSAIINGVATILLFALIDPQLSVMTDDVMDGKVDEATFRRTIVWISFSRLAGTVLAQAVFLPSAHLVAWVANYV